MLKQAAAEVAAKEETKRGLFEVFLAPQEDPHDHEMDALHTLSSEMLESSSVQIDHDGSQMVSTLSMVGEGNDEGDGEGVADLNTDEDEDEAKLARMLSKDEIDDDHHYDRGDDKETIHSLLGNSYWVMQW